MLIRAMYSVKNLLITDLPTTFHYRDQREIEIEIRLPTEEEVEAGHDESKRFAVATASFSTSDKNKSIFRQLEGRRLNSDASHGVPAPGSPDWSEEENEASYSLSDYPQHFQDLIDGRRRELSKAVRHVVGAIRWRGNIRGPSRPLGLITRKWSRDGTEWYELPRGGVSFIHFNRHISVPEDIHDEIEQLAQDEGGEPVHHELFREAWSQRSANPHSALVIGIAAAEVGTKQCIARLLPKAQWLALEIPSPSLRRILSEFLPQLPAENTIDGEVKPPPDSVLDEIENCTHKRHKTVHAGAEEPFGSGRLIQMLKAVQDLLWLLDYYCGFDWALDHIRPEVLEELGVGKDRAFAPFSSAVK